MEGRRRGTYQWIRARLRTHPAPSPQPFRAVRALPGEGLGLTAVLTRRLTSGAVRAADGGVAEPVEEVRVRQFIRGPNVKAFEEEAAAYLGVKRAVGVANGTDALVLVSTRWDRAGRRGPLSGVHFLCDRRVDRDAARRLFADIDSATLNLDPEDVSDRITERTKAIMPVHLFGRPAPLAELASLGVPLIEDAAQAFGAPGIAQTGVASTPQLLPDEEPLLPRGRRVGDRQRRRPRGEDPHARLPRLARQDHVRLRRLQLRLDEPRLRSCVSS